MTTRTPLLEQKDSSNLFSRLGKFMPSKKTLKSLAFGALAATAFDVSAAVEPLRTSGNQILVGGEAKALGGHSLFWHNVPEAGALYNAETITRLKNDWNSKVIRAAIGIEVGFNSDRTYHGDKNGSLDAIDRVVNAAVANDMYAIIDFHTHHANDIENTAHDFFSTVSSRYGHLDNVIYEVFNEPEWCGEQSRWGSTIKPYAERVISTIRQNDPDNLVIVGTTCFSQDVDVAAADQINDVNVAYTLHFYAASHKQDLRNKAQLALDRGAPLFVTEWGTTIFDGNGFVDEAETRTWINWLNERGISHANWSASTQPESSAIWNGDFSYKQSGNLVGELVQATNGQVVDDIVGPCDLNFAPSKVEVESFCRAKGIQFEDTSDTGGGQNIGWVDAGDWITFDVDIPSSGEYSVDYRVASDQAGGAIRMELENGDVLGRIDVGATGGWQQWTTRTHTAQLPQGTQTLRLVADSGPWNLNWFELRGGEPCVGADCPCTGADCPCVGDDCPCVGDDCPCVGADCPCIGDSCEPVKFEAESFSAMDGIQTENTSDVGGGQNIGWTDAGDWLVYDGALPASSNDRYEISYRVAREPGGDATIKIEQPGGAVNYGEIKVPSTGGWQSWTTVSHTVTIPSGTNGFAIAAVTGGWNLNWIEVRADSPVCVGDDCPCVGDDCPCVGDDCPCVGDGCPCVGDNCPCIGDNCPCTGADCPCVGDECPCTSDDCLQTVLVEAENYGAFNDSTPGNTGGDFRNDDVDVEATADVGGGFNVGWIDAGEWLEYDFSLDNAGPFLADIRVASDQEGGELQLQIDGVNAGAALSVGSSNGWQTWTTKNIDVGFLQSGNHTLRVNVANGPFNLNWIELRETLPVPAAACFSASESRLSVSVDASCSAGSNLTYLWDFGDGSSASGSSVSHTYASANTYTVSLTVNDANGIDSTTQSIVVDNSAPAGPVEFYGELRVNGNRINGSNTGQPAQVRGMSLFWSNTGWGQEKWWNAPTVDRMVDEFKVELIRAAMGTDEGGGYLHDRSNEDRLRTVVEQAIARNIYVIIDWHTHHAEDNVDEAIDFFSRMAQDYGHHDNVIFEVYNEPLNTTSWGTIKNYAERVIPAIRAHSDNLIVVGTRTWSQNTDEASFDKINDSNTAYALHFYVGSHGNAVRELSQTALNNGAAIFATEWGIWPNDNWDGMNADDWHNFLDDNMISSANWAISDKWWDEGNQLEPPSMFNGNGSLSTNGQWVADKLSTYAETAPWRN
ncbi:MAG: endoglucanase [Flavobacteriales bacterium]|jgi:endoglucanase